MIVSIFSPANCEGCVLSGEQAQKRSIAAFLGRVMHGTQIPGMWYWSETSAIGTVFPLWSFTSTSRFNFSPVVW